ncbi:hypothetical protein GCM10010912_36610 [Paenibacillus albidus]|uniref:DUF3592 domain-containing protein n=1 Tax=Paenibacillus albidus TaxID=2041023 RepID=A0A917CGG2_9BACL|nr:hypothetical protein [Paenibacillus albidus]GGF88030.1 hypothetical protein GCM10010912_36610 [Paenibacillus albidus]
MLFINTSVIVILIVLFSTMTGILTVYFAISKIRVQKENLRSRQELVKSGIPAQARIKSIRQLSSTMNDRPEVELELELTQENGERVDAMTRTFIPLTHIPRFQPGNIIEVRYSKAGNILRVEPADAYFP